MKTAHPSSLLTILLLVTTISFAGEIPIRSGQKLAFLGDSITAMGAGQAGYCTLVVAGLEANGIEVVLIPAGHSGDTSSNMLGRLGPDVINKKADWMTLSCGVNDVNNPHVAVPLDKFKTNTRSIVERAQAAGIKVMILTATPNSETLDSEKNTTVAQYNASLRELAEAKGCLLADVNADFRRVIQQHLPEDAKSPRPGHYLMHDDLHPNFERGNPEMARTVLRTFGLDDAQMAKAQEAWLDLPGRVSMYVPGVPFEVKVSVRQETLLKTLAERHKLTRPSEAAGRLFALAANGLPADATAAQIDSAFGAPKSKAPAITKSDADRLTPIFLAYLNTLAANATPK